MRREQWIPRPIDEVFAFFSFDYRFERIGQLFAAAAREPK
jgi:hypothetical protein